MSKPCKHRRQRNKASHQNIDNCITYTGSLYANKGKIHKLNSKKGCIKCIDSEKINTTFLSFNPKEIILNVGDDKEFKRPQEAIDSLKGMLILAPVTINIDPGLYPGISLEKDWFSFTNDSSLINIIGDTRTIVNDFFLPNATWVNGYNVFNNTMNIVFKYLQLEDKTKIYATGSLNNKIKTNGLESGDEVVIYNNDRNFNGRKDLRFLNRIVIDVDSEGEGDNEIEYFTISGDLLEETNNGVLTNNSTITFLPNVKIQSSTDDPGFCILIDSVSCSITGLTCVEPDFDQIPDDSLYIFGGVDCLNSDLVLTNVVIQSTTWVDVTVPIRDGKCDVNIKGFSFQSGFVIFKGSISTTGTFLTVLGTGHSIESTCGIGFANSVSIRIAQSLISGQIRNSGSIGAITSPNSTSNMRAVEILNPANKTTKDGNFFSLAVINPTDENGNKTNGFVISEATGMSFNGTYISDTLNGIILIDTVIANNSQCLYFSNVSDVSILSQGNSKYTITESKFENISRAFVVTENSIVDVIGLFTESIRIFIDNYQVSAFESKDDSILTVDGEPILTNPGQNAVDYCTSGNGQIIFKNIIPEPVIEQCPN